MKFYMPTKIYMGKDIVLQKAQEFIQYGKKAYIITGRRSAKINGALDDVINALKSVAIEYEIFDEVEENPSLETIEKAARKGVKSSVDFIIGIGGGSPIDAAKAIAIMIKNPQLDKDTVLTNRALDAIDLIAIPTTSGTGTETTQYSIVTVHREKTKKNLGQSVFPKISLLDAKYTEFMGKDTTVNTAIDALSHIIEGYLNVNANIITDGLAEKALRIWGECIGELLKGEFSFKTRENLMVASTIAGMIIAQTGTSLPHGMGYSLTYFNNIPHGLANGCLYKEYLRVFKKRDKVNNIWRELGLESYENLESLLDKLINVEIDVNEDILKQYTDLMWNNKSKLKNHPEEITYEELYNIYKNSLRKKRGF